jgi:hypothetical protein
VSCNGPRADLRGTRHCTNVGVFDTAGADVPAEVEIGESAECGLVGRCGGPSLTLAILVEKVESQRGEV